MTKFTEQELNVLKDFAEMLLTLNFIDKTFKDDQELYKLLKKVLENAKK